MKTIKEILARSTQYLAERGITPARREAEEIIADALSMKRLDLYMAFDKPLDEAELERCREVLRRRGQGEPPQYIRGEVDFLDCRLKINKDVLIPRQETEILAQLVIDTLKKQDLTAKVLWELCCGSAGVALVLKKQLPVLRVVGSDLSEAALAIARENARLNAVEVELRQGDLLAPFAGEKADFVVCNPPYISEAEYQALDREVRDFEPRHALVGGASGLEFYERLAAELPAYLQPNAQLFFEIGATQGPALLALFSRFPWSATLRRDYAGHDRFLFCQFR